MARKVYDGSDCIIIKLQLPAWLPQFAKVYASGVAYAPYVIDINGSKSKNTCFARS